MCSIHDYSNVQSRAVPNILLVFIYMYDRIAAVVDTFVFM